MKTLHQFLKFNTIPELKPKRVGRGLYFNVINLPRSAKYLIVSDFNTRIWAPSESIPLNIGLRFTLKLNNDYLDIMMKG